MVGMRLAKQVASGLYFYQLENRRNVVNAENGYFEVAVSDQLLGFANSTQPTKKLIDEGVV